MLRRTIPLNLLALVLTTGGASAQQRTYYDSSGKVIARSATDSQGTVTTYDARGNVIGRASAPPTRDCSGRPATMSGKPC
ncbi:hypothetical protein JQ636_37905 [Bradyrhizobium japonicum]|uniref:hypothetical protein n=1 Tax=Bradyrhizobium japonicum TaxID=375 RepID=UPI001BA543D1|nr:hypothetical protein [Bradyrhizobium japonicum]MBR0809338.1 hypothetical protein [Bradyrhizobium japonicum]